MNFFKRKPKEKEETAEEMIDRVIKETAGKHFMFIDPDYDIWFNSEDLDMFYEKGWEVIALRGYLCISWLFKKRWT